MQYIDRFLKRCRLPPMFALLTVALRIATSDDENFSQTTQSNHASEEMNFTCQQQHWDRRHHRTMDGMSNNLEHPEWGAILTPYLRFGFGVSFGDQTCNQSADPSGLNNLTLRLLLQSNKSGQVNHKYNMLLMQWGQFMAHEITRSTSGNGRCPCSHSSAISPEADNFEAKGNSSFAQQHLGRCPATNCDVNHVTAFLDASAVYGSSCEAAADLREAGTGLLKMDVFRGRQVLPLDHGNGKPKCSNVSCPNATFRAGDDRLNIFLGIAAIQTSLAREHNRLVKKLRELNPNWTGEGLYMEARKIVGAEIQHITYTEWLPKILGSSFSGDKLAYNPSVDPSITIEFAAAAFRFGHGMIIENISRLSQNESEIAEDNLSLTDGILHSERLINIEEGGPDAIIRGMLHSPIRSPSSVVPTVAGKWPKRQCPLASLDILRGREQRISTYTACRAHCGLENATSFDGFADTIADKPSREKLKASYETPDKVDLFVGGMLEKPVPGGMIGPTFACIVGDQFQRLRIGDRFFYEHVGVFTKEQLDAIRTASLGRILCDNSDNIQSAPRDAFKLVEFEEYTACETIPSMDLSAWG